MERANGTLEDVAAEIGYTATSRLVAWFGGANLYVPATATEDHAVARLIGFPAFRRLVAEYGGTTLSCGVDRVERRLRPGRAT